MHITCTLHSTRLDFFCYAGCVVTLPPKPSTLTLISGLSSFSDVSTQLIIPNSDIPPGRALGPSSSERRTNRTPPTPNLSPSHSAQNLRAGRAMANPSSIPNVSTSSIRGTDFTIDSRYALQKFVGCGSYGVVCAAVDTRDPAQVFPSPLTSSSRAPRAPIPRPPYTPRIRLAPSGHGRHQEDLQRLQE